jgi:hypothetical protein
MPDAALFGSGPYFANRSALKYMVLGRAESAQRLLDGYLARLLATLPALASTQSEDFKLAEQLAELYEEAHIGVWLRNGVFDLELARSAFDYACRLHFDVCEEITTANLLHLMLLATESGNPERASSLYRELDPKPLSLPPQNLRFSRNPRAVLFAHLDLSESPEHHGTLDGALQRFVAYASQWERDVQPIPYVGLVEAARIVFAADFLRDRPATVADVAQQIA